MNTTKSAACHMLGNGWYTAARLGAELNISAQRASGVIYNIRNSKKYQVEVTDLPNRKVRVVSIEGKTKAKADLWRLALFGGKAA